MLFNVVFGLRQVLLLTAPLPVAAAAAFEARINNQALPAVSSGDAAGWLCFAVCRVRVSYGNP